MKFIENELISLIPVIMIKNHRMSKIHSVQSKIRNMKDVMDLGFDMVRHRFAKKN